MSTYAPLKTESIYSPSRAFLLQIHSEADLNSGLCRGRIEQITSGEAIHFNSLEELLAFLNAKLMEIHQARVLYSD